MIAAKVHTTATGGSLQQQFSRRVIQLNELRAQSIKKAQIARFRIRRKSLN